ncbi:fungal specific transcription factor domain-containing protein [Colletotrichum higginsianum]|nr:fungal specific transcription factor domain-containing protein [Colletotrichum higginsianum]
MDLDTDGVDSGVGIGTGSNGNGNANANVSLNGGIRHHPGVRRYSHSHHNGGEQNNGRHAGSGNGNATSSSSSKGNSNGTGPGSGTGTGNGNGHANGNTEQSITIASSTNGTHQHQHQHQHQQLASPPLTHPSASSNPPASSSSAETARRRRHRDKERVRVTRACDRCKKRKIRCTGIQPCELCIRTESHCTYNASYARGRQPPVATREDVARMDLDGLDVCVSDPNAAASASAGESSLRRTSSSMAVDVSTDLQGHYVGPSSGVSFLLRVQKRLHQAVSFSQASSIFTFGDAPLPDFDPSGAFCVLLSKDEATTLLKRYFDFAVPTHRFLHRPTVEAWLEEFYSTMGAMRSQEDAPRAGRCCLWSLLRRRSTWARRTRGRMQMRDHQLSKERGAVRLTSVQARLCQCFWLLSQSRINHCWSLFGTAGHLALAIGLNRNRHADPAGGYNYIELECRRRTFWCAYSLDNYLSAALGRRERSTMRTSIRTSPRAPRTRTSTPITSHPGWAAASP